MNEKIQLGFIGCGGMASAHMKAIAPREDIEIVAFCDIDPAKVESRIAEWKQQRPEANPRAFSDPVTMLSTTNPDAVYILLPPFAHGPAEQACLTHNKPFFVEKPLSLDLGFSREVAAEVEKKGLITSAGYVLRYQPTADKARQLLQSDPAILICGGYVIGSPNPKPGDTSIVSWWVQKDKSGGQIVEQSTHVFDFIRYLCGEAVEVFAHATRGFNQGIYRYTIDDASSVSVAFASGAVASLVSCCAANGGGGGLWLNIYAHGTSLLFTGAAQTLKILRKDMEPEEMSGVSNMFAVEDNAFLDAIRTGDPAGIRSNYADATRTLELTLAANKSIETGKPIAISR